MHYQALCSLSMKGYSHRICVNSSMTFECPFLYPANLLDERPVHAGDVVNLDDAWKPSLSKSEARCRLRESDTIMTVRVRIVYRSSHRWAHSNLAGSSVPLNAALAYLLSATH